MVRVAQACLPGVQRRRYSPQAARPRPQALVFTRDGDILWKMSIQSFDSDILASPGAMERLESPDSGRIHLIMIGVYLAIMIAILIPAKTIRTKPEEKKAPKE